MYGDPVPETDFYPDNEELVATIIKRDWSLPIGYEPDIRFEPEALMTNAGVGSVYVYSPSDSSQIVSTDYNSVGLTSYVSIRVSARYREHHRIWCKEILRIIMANRRAGKGKLGPYTYMEYLTTRRTNDLSGFYTATIEIRLRSHNTPILTAGMGEDINREVHEAGFPPSSKYQDADPGCMRAFDTTLGGMQ